MRREDQHRLRHIRQAAEDALQFVSGRTRAALDEDRVLARALVNCVQEIGEAAANLSSEVKTAIPSVPWRSIVGMRNRLVHGYFDQHGPRLGYDHR